MIDFEIHQMEIEELKMQHTLYLVFVLKMVRAGWRPNVNPGAIVDSWSMTAYFIGGNLQMGGELVTIDDKTAFYIYKNGWDLTHTGIDDFAIS